MSREFEPKKRFSDNEIRRYTTVAIGLLSLSCILSCVGQTRDFLTQKDFNIVKGQDPEGVNWIQAGGYWKSLNISWDKGSSFFSLTTQNQPYITSIYDASGIDAGEIKRHLLLSSGIAFTQIGVTIEIGNNSETGLPMVLINR